MAERELPDPNSGPDCLSRMVAEFSAPLYRYAYRLAGSGPDAEDLVQQTFLVAQTQMSQLRDASCRSAWLHSILRHAWCKQCRRKRIHGEALQHLESKLRLTTEQTDGVDREQLQEALNELPADFRLVVLMYFFEDLSYQEIAQQVGIPIGTVMSRLSRAKQHLRRRLQSKPETALPMSRIHRNSNEPASCTAFQPISIS